MEFRGRKAAPENGFQLVDVPTVFKDSKDDAFLVYGDLPESYKYYGKMLGLVQYDQGYDSDGVWQAAKKEKIFGTVPATLNTEDRVATSRANHIFPTVYRRIIELGRFCMTAHEVFNKEHFEEQREEAYDKFGQHLIPGTIYTSAIVSDIGEAVYNREVDMMDLSWCAMCVFKDNVLGGDLVFPELEKVFTFSDPGYILFQGGELMHGVSETKLLNEWGYRYSVLFYADKAIADEA